ncbi:MAG: hypothetical protein ABFQ95_02910, partial [Pseudomonadota bacterium]
WKKLVVSDRPADHYPEKPEDVAKTQEVDFHIKLEGTNDIPTLKHPEICLTEAMTKSDGTVMFGDPVMIDLDDLVMDPDDPNNEDTYRFLLNDTFIGDGMDEWNDGAMVVSDDGYAKITIDDASENLIKIMLTDTGEDFYNSLKAGEESTPAINQWWIYAFDEGGKQSNLIDPGYKVVGQNDAPTARDNMYMATEDDFEDDGIYLSGNIITDDTGDGADSDPEGDMLTVTELKDVMELNDPNGDLTVELTGDLEITVTLDQDNFAVLTVMTDGSLELVSGMGDTFGGLNSGETYEFKFGYTLADNGDPVKTDMAEVNIKIKGEDDQFDFEFNEPSNLVLYLDDDTDNQDGEYDVKKIKFEGGDRDLIDTNMDNTITSDEMYTWIDSHSAALMGNTELIAFSIKDGNLPPPLPPEDGGNQDILGPGEGQLVFLDGLGFEVTDPSDPFTIEDDVIFDSDGMGGYTSDQLADTVLDPATQEGSDILMDMSIAANTIPENMA